jgi:hypothetical protein
VVFDPHNEQLVLIGRYTTWGTSNRIVPTFTIKALKLGSAPLWNNVHRYGEFRPGSLATPTAVWNSARGNILVYGGVVGSNKVWTLSFGGPTYAGWTPIWHSVRGSPPSSRTFHTAIFDPVRDRMIVFGGYDSSTDWFGPEMPDDLWELSFAGDFPQWNEITPLESPRADTRPTRNAVQTTGDLALESALPNPCRSQDGFSVRFSLSGPGHASLALYDVRGRQIAIHNLSTLGPGRHTVRFGDSKSLAPGIYIIRLTQGKRSLNRRMAVLR